MPTKISKYSICVFLILFVKSINSQVDFNNYTTLLSKGKMPDDFSKFTYKKVESDLKKERNDIDYSLKKEFYLGVNYSIDDILHSGKVVYGDEISLYIQTIVEKILANEPELYKELRFYLLKSNECNAFSTDQGIIFVTTGLIAQLENEAQLAFVLAHEISHYVKKHVVNMFNYSSKRKLNISALSSYSRENEFEADTYGIKWYKDAGYSKDELFSVFDILMYSYLPYNEIVFPKDYFNTSQMYIPEDLFTNVDYEITATEDYNDEKSSHPNIKKRKEAVNNEIEKSADWQNNIFLLDKNTFTEIQNICRFEGIRESVFNGNYVDALYSVFLLEKDFPNSLFLKRMKAQIWYGLSIKQKIENNEVNLNNKLQYEGEIARLNYFIEHLSEKAIITLALRQIFDLTIESNQDEQINLIYKAFVRSLTNNKYFILNDYQKVKFKEFLEQKINEKKDEIQSLDNNKYDKINSKKEDQLTENIKLFYLFGISDIIIDPIFLSLLSENQLVNSNGDKTIKFIDLLNMNPKDRIVYLKEKKKNKLPTLKIQSLIIVEPVVTSQRFGINDPIRTEKMGYDFSRAIDKSAEETDVKLTFIDRNHMDSTSTKIFNNRSLLYGSISQIYRETSLDIIPVDFELLKEIEKEYDCSNVAFIWVDHKYFTENVSYNVMKIWMGICYPIAAPYIYLSGHKMQINMLIFNLKKGEVETTQSYFIKDIPKYLQLRAIMFDIFSTLKQ